MSLYTGGHKILYPKSKSNPNRKIQSVPDPKCKKYLNRFSRVLQNISESEVLLTEPEHITQNPKNTRKPEKISGKSIRMSKLIYNINI